MIQYNGMFPRLNENKLQKYKELTGRPLNDEDVDMYVRNHVKDNPKDAERVKTDVALISKIIDEFLDVEIRFRS
ncbi:MAG: hypothetical protein K6G10_06940 [Butyrivibrio sp.]|nr:hypothetical protein [Butyrivibrio sp.]